MSALSAVIKITNGRTNPMKPSIQTPWRIAQATRLAIMPAIIILEAIGCFWATWAAVYRPVR